MRLTPREKPFRDEAKWWWAVTRADDVSFDVIYGGRQRFGVGYERVIEVRE